MKSKEVDWKVEVFFKSAFSGYKPCLNKKDAEELKSYVEQLKDIKCYIETEYDFICESCNKVIEEKEEKICSNCSKKICDNCCCFGEKDENKQYCSECNKLIIH
jgi:hypothetical protein